MKRRYTLEFKLQAIALASVPNVSVRSVAKDLGITSQTLEYWMKHPPGAAAAAAPVDTNDPAILKVRLNEAESKLRRLQADHEILKKAAAFFAREHL